MNIPQYAPKHCPSFHGPYVEPSQGSGHAADEKVSSVSGDVRCRSVRLSYKALGLYWPPKLFTEIDCTYFYCYYYLFRV